MSTCFIHVQHLHFYPVAEYNLSKLVVDSAHIQPSLPGSYTQVSFSATDHLWSNGKVHGWWGEETNTIKINLKACAKDWNTGFYFESLRMLRLSHTSSTTLSSSVNHWYFRMPVLSARTLRVTRWFTGTHMETGCPTMTISEKTNPVRFSVVIRSHFPILTSIYTYVFMLRFGVER